MVGEWGEFWWLGKLGQVWGEYGRSGEMCWGVRSVLGCGKYGEVWGMGSRNVEMCLGCGERCGKGVGVGAMWEEGGVTIWDPNSPDPPQIKVPNPFDSYSSDPSDANPP